MYEDIKVYCEICEINHATELKGGIYNNERQMWLCCKQCKEKIEDTRINDRKQDAS